MIWGEGGSILSVRERVGLNSHRSAKVPNSRTVIDLVLVGDDHPVIL